MPAPTRTTRAAAAYEMTEAEFREYEACSPAHGLAGFLRFAGHLKIKDKKTHREIPFDFWPCQTELSADLVAGSWLLCLKARQMGMTWLVAAYALWRMTYHAYYTVVVICQNKRYAEDFVADKVRFMHSKLPRYLQIPVVRETRERIVFGDEHRSEIQAFAAGKKAARSLTSNLFIADEAAFMENIEDTHRGVTPTLEETGGQSIIISTSNGPKGFFYEEAEKALAGKTIDEDGSQAYQFRFWSVFAHPGRDEAWYERMARKHAHRALHMHYEFPRTPEEAFTSAGGRIYPLFTRQQVPEGHLLDLDSSTLKRRPEWNRYRFIDWGTSKSAFVCLWAVHIPAKHPRLTVHSSCHHLIREMLAYCYKEGTTEPDKKNDHGPDALRYGIVTFNLTGHVHVYREFYIHDLKSGGYTCQAVIADIRKLSGWELLDERSNIWRPGPEVESFAGTVYDRSNAILANEFWAFKEHSCPHVAPTHEAGSSPRSEVANGIDMLNKLVIGGMPNKSSVQLTPEQKRQRMLNARDPFEAAGLKVALPITEIVMKNEQRRQRLAKKRRRNFAGS